MTLGQKGINDLLLEWVEARKEADRVESQYVATKGVTPENPDLPKPERVLDSAGLREIALARKRVDECGKALMEAVDREAQAS
jgi:hypothetical protein